MALWKKIFGMDKVIEKGGELIDEAVNTSQERAERDATDTTSARAMTAPSHETWFDALVDGVNRLVRPAVTVWMVGGFIGWWPLPKTGAVSEYWQNLFMLVITFWFGGRAILKDLPAAIKLMRG